MVSTFIALFLISTSALAVSPVDRAIREAENLSILKDRLPACTVLNRTIKKANTEEVRHLREKLAQLSTIFYTDKGFQDFLAGKELFEKQRFSDALDKLVEADDSENGNVLVLHYLGLAQLWMKKEVLALGTIRRGLQINPYEVDLLKDDLAAHSAQDDWAEALVAAKTLSSTVSDIGAESLQHWGVALIETGESSAGLKLISQAKAKNQTLAEPYYWLGAKSDTQPNSIFLKKYIELCTAKVPYFAERDPRACLHLSAAQKLNEKADE